MPQRTTAKKELRKNVKRRLENLKVKRDLKTTIKKLKKTLEKKDAKERGLALKAVYKSLDKAARKKVIHPNKAAREKSRFARLVNKASGRKKAA